jgi:hypothetical protein
MAKAANFGKLTVWWVGMISLILLCE